MTVSEEESDDLVSLHVDGKGIAAVRGQSLLAALVVADRRVLRRNSVTGEPRAGYCGMGICFECEVEVDGLPAVRACMVVIDRAMTVRTSQQTADCDAEVRP